MDNLCAMPRPADNLNISLLLTEVAAAKPTKTAVVVSGARASDGKIKYSRTTFAELEELTGRLAAGFLEQGCQPGEKALLMLKPGVEFIAVAFALFRIGVVPIMIDPGIGMTRVLECIRKSEPDYVLGIPQAILLRYARRSAFRTVKKSFVSGRYFPSALAFPLSTLARTPAAEVGAVEQGPESLVAILFTTGSTGAPKGVEYTPSVIRGQLAALAQTYGLTADDVDMPIMPVFVLGTLALGMTVVIPPIDPTQPVKADSAAVVEVIRDNAVTFSFGSPAVWNKVTRYCVQHGITLPSLRHLLVAGAPTPGSTLRLLPRVITHGEFHTPIGATEGTPFAEISGREILQETLAKTERGAGFCVGRPMTTHEVRIIRVTEDVIEDWSQAECLPAGEIGEIVVTGPVVTKRYFMLPEATRSAKIYDGSKVWHRLGDVGYLDEKGRVWFCGRKSHVAHYAGKAYYTVQVENLFNPLPQIWRTALVSLEGDRGLALCVELQPEHAQATKRDWQAFEHELRAIATMNDIPIRYFLAHDGSFPVDKRHNAKIERPQLAVWAAQQIARSGRGDVARAMNLSVPRRGGLVVRTGLLRPFALVALWLSRLARFAR
ncbi:MAG TPA: fatty acid CoA ligase family protein [Polyangiales bacterium]